VGSAQLKKGAVTPAKLAKSTRKALAGPRGPAGTQGAAGSAGPPGPAGAVGPSDTYAAGSSSGSLTNSFTTIASVVLPAGSYVLQGKIEVYVHTAATAGQADCLLSPAATGVPTSEDEDGGFMPALAGQQSGLTVSLLGVDTFGSEQTVRLICRQNSGAVDYENARLTATRTGALHATLPLPID
jgi:hypothetical protein